MCLCAAEAETRFVFTVENFDIESGLQLYARDPFIGICGIANCARRYRSSAFRSELARQGFHSRESFDCGFTCFAAQLAGFLNSAAKPRRRLHFIDNAYRSRGRDVGDYLPNGVAANVDRGDANVAGGLSPRSGV
jgi:hypothetical protein